MTIPRLELLAILIIGIRCLKYVQENIDMEISKRVVFSDSQCALYLIESNKKLTMQTSQQKL